jgi:hypothetical protein
MKSPMVSTIRGAGLMEAVISGIGGLKKMKKNLQPERS